MDYFEVIKRRELQKAAEAEGRVADSMEVRMALMERVHSGEITLTEAQDELKRLKRDAKRSGKITREQAWRGH